MSKRTLFRLAVLGFIVILIVGVVSQLIHFNNTMISLQEMKKSELETTKIEYGQCIIKILETNQIAKAYKDDVLELAAQAGFNLNQFHESIIALIGTQVIPKLSKELRLNVQREIVACRNAYTGRVDLNLKPLYINFNRLQKIFPNNVYNALFFHWKTDDLNVPKASYGDQIFQKNEIKELDLH